MKIKQIPFAEKIEISVKEWNDDVKAYLKPFNAFETLAFNDLSLMYYDRELSVEARFNAAFDAVQLALVDADGRQLLQESDREAVKNASFEPITRVFSAVYSRRNSDEFETVKKN